MREAIENILPGVFFKVAAWLVGQMPFLIPGCVFRWSWMLCLCRAVALRFYSNTDPGASALGAG